MSTKVARKTHKIKVSAPNILRVWREATVAELDHGMNWYADAHTLCEALTPHDVRIAAGVTAALSPRMPWGRNIMLAGRAVADGYASGAMTDNMGKADAILGGALPLDVLGGDKVRAFYSIIVDPEHADAVCVDRHAFDVAMGRVGTDKSRRVLDRVGVYEQIARAYRRAARLISEETGVQVTPAQVQAVTWVTWRRLKGIAD